MTRRLTSVSGRALIAVLVGLVVVGGVALTLARHDAAAQFGPGQPGQPGFMPPMPMGPPGGQGIAMLVHKDMIYIAQNGTLYKIDPAQMKVVDEVQYLKPPAPPGPPPR